MLHFFELLNKLAFQVDVLVLQFLLFVGVIGDIVVELIHLLLQSLQTDLYFIYFLLKGTVAVI